MDPRLLAELHAFHQANPAAVGYHAPLFYNLNVTNRFDQRLDANETMFLTRELEHVRAKTYEVKQASLLARSFLPTAADIPNWAHTVVEIIYDSSGRAQVISNGTQSLPRVDVVASEQTYKVVSIGAAYAFTVMDLRQAVALGKPLEATKALTSRRVIDTAIDEILATGALATVNQSFGMSGFVNHASIPIVADTGGSWATITADAMIADFSALIEAPGVASKQIFEVTDVIVAPVQWNKMNRTPRSTNSDTTVLEFLRKNFPGVTFHKWHRLTGVGGGGDNRSIAYHKSPEVIEAIVPQEYETFPAQQKGLELETPCHARAAGVRLHHPNACADMDHAA
jgi:hypothetical protein